MTQINMDEIKQKEELILKLTQEMEKSLREGNRKNLLAKIKQAEFDLETLIMNYLEKNDETYIKLFNENFDLLINDNIDLVVTSEGASPFVSYAKELYGEIHSNGFLYFTTKKTNLITQPFKQNFTPLIIFDLSIIFVETTVLLLKKSLNLSEARFPQGNK